MELTPIKIARKSKGDYSKAALAARKAKVRINTPSCPTHPSFHISRLISQQKRSYRKGRPLRPSSIKEVDGQLKEPENLQTANEPKKRSLKNLKSKRKMSALERLPTELLQNVFLCCLSLNLPRASPVIAGKLSSPTMYSRTIMAAFGPTWDAWHGKDRNRRVEKDLSGGDVVLQVSEILAFCIESLPVSVRYITLSLGIA